MTKVVATTVVAAVAGLVCSVSLAAAQVVVDTDDPNFVVLENPFLKVQFDRNQPGISLLAGSFHGDASAPIFEEHNVLALPIVLEVNYLDEDGVTVNTRSSHVDGAGAETTVTQFGDANNCRVVEIDGVVDSVERTCATEKWTMSLCPDDQSLSLKVSGSWTEDTCDITGGGGGSALLSVQRAIYLKQPSIYGLFNRGVTQMMECRNCTLPSDQVLERLYTIGKGASLDLTRLGRTEGSDHTLLLSQGDSFESGFKEVLVGELLDTNLILTDQWKTNFSWAEALQPPSPTSWASEWTLYPNDHAFPVYPVSLTARKLKDGIEFRDLRTAMMGVYGSGMGCLQSYFEDRDGTIAPTIANCAPKENPFQPPQGGTIAPTASPTDAPSAIPTEPPVPGPTYTSPMDCYGYYPNTNFFDPDNFVTLSAMLYTGDAYVVNEARKVLERTADTICGIGRGTNESYCSGTLFLDLVRMGVRPSYPFATTNTSFILRFY
jgi:hypothetical protein